jgi:hypothetical protein
MNPTLAVGDVIASSILAVADSNTLRTALYELAYRYQKLQEEYNELYASLKDTNYATPGDNMCIPAPQPCDDATGTSEQLSPLGTIADTYTGPQLRSY